MCLRLLKKVVIKKETENPLMSMDDLVKGLQIAPSGFLGTEGKLGAATAAALRLGKEKDRNGEAAGPWIQNQGSSASVSSYTKLPISGHDFHKGIYDVATFIRSNTVHSRVIQCLVKSALMKITAHNRIV